jgi:hypothetical protein
MITRIIMITVGAAMAWTIAFGLTEIYFKDRSQRVSHRLLAYLACGVGVVVVSIAIGWVAAGSIEAGDQEESTHRIAKSNIPGASQGRRNEIIRNVFLVAIVPSLIGVRCALGRRKHIVRGSAEARLV